MSRRTREDLKIRLRPGAEKWAVLREVDALLRTLPESKDRTATIKNFYDLASQAEDYPTLREAVATFITVT